VLFRSQVDTDYKEEKNRDRDGFLTSKKVGLKDQRQAS